MVYRYLEAHPGANVVDMANDLFFVAEEGPASTVTYLRKRSVRRVLDSLVWMRHQPGMVITNVPSYVPGQLSSFFIGEHGIDVLSVARTTKVVREFVTDKVSQGSEGLGGDAMGLYHPESD